MTRKDYELLAKTFNHHLATMAMSGKAEPIEFQNIGELAHKFADALSGDNPRFDRQRFLDACGVAK